jgi:hypothetical protein
MSVRAEREAPPVQQFSIKKPPTKRRKKASKNMKNIIEN